MSLRSFASRLDPTSSKAPLGQLVRAGINQIPGGSSVMQAVDLVNANKAPAPAPKPKTGEPAPAATFGGKVMAFIKRPVVLIVGGVVIVGAVLWFMVKK